MTEYRITKYDPNHRENGIYQVEAWTSIGDIGKEFKDGVLTHHKYEQMEQSYINCCIELLRKSNVSRLTVRNFEYYHEGITLPQVLQTEDNIRRAIMCCLQEKCWAMLENESFFVHFGFDYYMYIGTNLPYALVDQVAKEYNLFAELFRSPYRN